MRPRRRVPVRAMKERREMAEIPRSFKKNKIKEMRNFVCKNKY